MNIRIERIPKIQPELQRKTSDDTASNKSKQPSVEVSNEDTVNISDEAIKLLEQQRREDAERLVDHFKSHPESPVSLREAGPEIAKFEDMVTLFEATHSLAQLRLIVDISSDVDELFTYAPILADSQRIEDDIKTFELNSPAYVPTYKAKIARLQNLILSPEDARIYEMRRSAVTDLIPIKKMLDTLKTETNISAEQRKAVEEKYKRLTSAVGGIRNGKVDHDR